jgi:hypothetical protein
MKRSSISVLITKAENQKGPRALLRLILSLKTIILIVPSSTTMMHLMILNVGAFVDTNLHISS